MKQPAPSLSAGISIRQLFLLLAVLLAVVVMVLMRSPNKPNDPLPASPSPSAAKSFSVLATPKAALPNGSGLQSRRFAVATSTATHQWAVADARDTNVIRQIAHNELEYQRMVDENPRILRRQLVYRNETTAAVLERAKASGEAVKQLTLPGLDGQEIPFTISRADLEPSQQSGTFTGQLPDRPNSMVTLAFKFGREAFTVVSPDDGIFLQAWPREPGEIILTSFDPEKYLPLPGGEPIKTTNTFKLAQ